MPPSAERRSCGFAQLLVGSHNVRGLVGPASLSRALRVAQVKSYSQVWLKLGLVVVFLQEHHMVGLELRMLVERALAGVWKCFWCVDLEGAGGSGGQGRRGVGILVRKVAVDRQYLVLHDPVPPLDNGGRVLSMNAEWGGHKLQLASVYMPNDAAAQRRFIAERLKPLHAAAMSAGRQPVWGGDYNFVFNPSLERLQRVTEDGNVKLRPAPGTTTSVGQTWAAALPDMRDVWRERHPGARLATHFDCNGAARLDRVHVGADLAAYARAPRDARRPRAQGGAHLSDHCPVVLALAPRVPPGRVNAAPARLQLWFASDPELCAEFADWAAGRLEHMPAAHLEVLKWFCKLQRHVRWKVYRLNCVSRQRRAQADLARVPHEELEKLLDVVVGDDVALAAEAVAQIAAARAATAAAARAHEEVKQVRRRRRWVHGGERPTRALTMRLKRPAAAGVTTLVAPNGAVAATPAACAKVVTAHWAEVSKLPATTVAARQEVLAAVAQAGVPALGAQAVQELGAAAVTEQEVRKALRHSRPGTAPGGDGIPVQLYQKFKDQFAPLLARVFTAIGVVGRAPKGFLDSIITVLYKKGERTVVGNYRPISLTHTAYRLLAKTLGSRLGGVLPQLIDPAQTAFVQGRSIGENVMLLQLLPKLLEQRNRTALVAFCDFRKAYDTIDRSFLLAVMERLGVGDGLLRWVRLLHTETRSAALVNGALATPRQFHAGVRQGCPLAPLLYLFVGQALLCLLRARGVGLDVDGQLLSGAQYADDLKALLGMEQVPAFLEAMQLFAAASGQHLEPSKTQLLPVGKVAAMPATLAGLEVKGEAHALGFTFEAFTCDVRADWAALAAASKARMDKVAACRLSMFGRAHACNAYAISNLLYHSEFADCPEAVVANVEGWAARLVVRGEAPSSAATGSFVGVSAFNVVGRPPEGGLGVLPLREHVAARRAKWAVRLALGDGDTPWVFVGRLVAARLYDAEYGAAGSNALQLLAPPRPAQPGQEAVQFYRLPKVFRRMVQAMQALPPLEVVAEGGVLPGAWCYDAPLWGNPALACPGGGLERDPRVAELAGARVSTLGRALRARHLVQGWTVQQYNSLSAGAASVFGYDGRYVLGERHDALARLNTLVDDVLPQNWVQSCALVRPASEDVAAAGEAARVQAAASHIAGRLGWRCDGGKTLALGAYTVRDGTQLLLAGRKPKPRMVNGEERLPPTAELLLQRFAADAAPDLAAEDVKVMLRRMWSLRWDNEHKEVLWKLALDGVPTPARLHKPEQACGCGEAEGAGREHLFADCRAASHVRAAVAAELRGRFGLGGSHLQRQHLWLAQPPTGELHQGVWDVVCVAALNAMDKARVTMWARQSEQHQAPSAALADAAGKQAVAHFWALLADFCGLNMAPQRWQAEVSDEHPFLRWVAAQSQWRVFRC